jgi:anti-anti-sigma factor
MSGSPDSSGDDLPARVGLTGWPAVTAAGITGLAASVGPRETIVSTLSMSVTTTQWWVGGEAYSMVTLAGQADVGNSGQLREILVLESVRAHRKVLVDLSRVSSMDWWTALILLWIGQVLTRRGGSLTLTSPQPEVAGLLDYADVHGVLPPEARISPGGG